MYYRVFRLLSKPVRLTMIRNAVWALSNLCRGKSPPPAFSKVAPCLPVLAHLLNQTDAETLADACWALSYLSDGPNDKIQAVIDAGVCRRLVELLMCVSAVSNIIHYSKREGGACPSPRMNFTEIVQCKNRVAF